MGSLSIGAKPYSPNTGKCRWLASVKVTCMCECRELLVKINESPTVLSPLQGTSPESQEVIVVKPQGLLYSLPSQINCNERHHYNADSNN